MNESEKALVRESTERLRSFIRPKIQVDTRCLSDETLQDVWNVVAAYLFEHQEDDGEPLTEEWLRAVGFEQRADDEAELSIELFEGDAWLEVIPFSESVSQWWLYGHEFHPAPTSRRDVRQLCAGLHIELKEQSSASV